MRFACSIHAVFEKLRLGVKCDVETRQQLREDSEGRSDAKFTFTSSDTSFAASIRGCFRTFTLQQNHILVTNEKNRELMNATVTLTDDKDCRLAVGQEVLEEWQFRKRAMESLFFDETGGAR